MASNAPVPASAVNMSSSPKISVTFTDKTTKTFSTVCEWEADPKYNKTCILDAEHCEIHGFSKPFPRSLYAAYISHNPLTKLPIILPGSKLGELFVEHTNIKNFDVSLMNIKSSYIRFYYDKSPLAKIDVQSILNDDLKEWIMDIQDENRYKPTAGISIFYTTF